jgi:hypothetical protein
MRTAGESARARVQARASASGEIERQAATEALLQEGRQERVLAPELQRLKALPRGLSNQGLALCYETNRSCSPPAG